MGPGGPHPTRSSDPQKFLMRPKALAGYLFFGFCTGADILVPAGSIAHSESASPYGGGDPERGRQIFANHGCGWCHESSGRRPGRGPQLMNTTRSDEFIANRIATGSPGRMPAFGPALDDQKLRDLIAFIHAIKPDGA